MAAYADNGRKVCSIAMLPDGGAGPAVGEDIRRCVEWLARRDERPRTEAVDERR
jgi:hypothetical protein